jgi:hypothetical protein
MPITSRWPARIAAIVVIATALCAGRALFLHEQAKELQDCPEVQFAMQRAAADPKILAVVGTPLEKGWITDGSRDVFTPGGGMSEFLIPIRGPKGHGRLKVAVFDDIGVYKIREFELTPAGSAAGAD